MHCTSCGLLIDEDVEALDGVKSSTTSYKTETTTVIADCDVTADIIDAIREAGYTARLTSSL